MELPWILYDGLFSALLRPAEVTPFRDMQRFTFVP